MNEITLTSGHRIRNSSPGSLRSSTLPLGHGGSPQYWIFTSERGNFFVSLNLGGQSGVRAPQSLTFQACSFNHCTRATAPGSKVQREIFLKCFPTRLLAQEVTPSPSARNLDIVFDSALNFIYLAYLAIAASLVVGKLDYCIFLLFNVTEKKIKAAGCRPTELFGAGCDKVSSFLSHNSSSKIFALVTCSLQSEILIVVPDLPGSDQWTANIYSKHASAIAKGTDTLSSDLDQLRAGALG